MFMGRREHAAVGTTLLVALGLGPSACVKDAPLDAQTHSSTNEAETTTGPLLPLAAGHSWTYRVTKEGKASTKVLKVAAKEEVGGEGPNAGRQAFKITSSKDGKADAVTWEAAEGKRFVRYREQELSKSGDVKAETHWEPPRLVVDGERAHVAAGASWPEQYEETVREDGKDETSDEKDTWSVDAVDATITVPAGTFKALVLRRQSGKKAKTLWYVQGVGKVREEGDELEELTAYSLRGGDADARDDTSRERDDGDDTAMDPSSDSDGDAEPMPGSDDDGNVTGNEAPDAGARAATSAMEATP